MKRFSPYTNYRVYDIDNIIREKIPGMWDIDPTDDQCKIIRSILSGNDTFAILPTGAGKSVCFQAPSILFPGITLVITPLVALIEDQVKNFNERGLHDETGAICYRAIHPGMETSEDKGYTGCQVQYKLLYASPERISRPKFIRALKAAEEQGTRIDHIVLDEVHCLSQWGFEFRESYLNIINFIKQRPIRPIISAFTATATPRDIAEIRNILGLSDLRIIREAGGKEDKIDAEDASIKGYCFYREADYTNSHGIEIIKEKNPQDAAQKDKKPKKPQNYTYKEIFRMAERTNLSLTVIPCSDDNPGKAGGGRNSRKFSPGTRYNELIRILKREENFSKVCIIYRTTVNGVDKLYEWLAEDEMFEKRVVKYHGRLSAHQKEKNKELFWSKSDSDGKEINPSVSRHNIMVATKAFGMGIDIEDISLIIHYDMPRSLEDYYQEVGRAARGRNKVKNADCYLLYSIGPSDKAGTLWYTTNWVVSGKETDPDYLPIYSQFSDQVKDTIHFWAYYRLCYMAKYCERFSGEKGSDAAHKFIIDYLTSNLEDKLTREKAIHDLSDFYEKNHESADLDNTAHYVLEETFTDRYLRSYLKQPDREDGNYHTEILQLINKINELHINNTHLANWLRGHPDDYELGIPHLIVDKKETHRITFTIRTMRGSDETTYFDAHDDEKISYFDMCVLDAIYTIEISQKKSVFVQTIRELLTGRNPRYSSQGKREFEKAIRNSIDKMRAMSISIIDMQIVRLPSGKQNRRTRYQIENEPFLSLEPREGKGYAFSEKKVPPLFRYAEAINGQIIRIPVSLFNVSMVEHAKVWKEDFTAESHCRHSSDVERLKTSLEKDKPIPAGIFSEKDHRRLEKIRNNMHSFKASVDNALLCHYLLHRIAISKNKKKGNYILFSTIRRITNMTEDSCLFHKKAAAIMSHYREIGYLHQYYFYIKDYNYRLVQKKSPVVEDNQAGHAYLHVVDNAYFNIQANDIEPKSCYLQGRLYFYLSDFHVQWSKQNTLQLQESNPGFSIKTDLVNALRAGYILSPDTKRNLEITPLSRMDGIVLQHKNKPKSE